MPIINGSPFTGHVSQRLVAANGLVALGADGTEMDVLTGGASMVPGANTEWDFDDHNFQTVIALRDNGTTAWPVFYPSSVTPWNGAPPDAMLDLASFVLWLDATIGAVKLMAKAKSANGTVVTAVVASLT